MNSIVLSWDNNLIKIPGIWSHHFFRLQKATAPDRSLPVSSWRWACNGRLTWVDQSEHQRLLQKRGIYLFLMCTLTYCWNHYAWLCMFLREYKYIAGERERELMLCMPVSNTIRVRPHVVYTHVKVSPTVTHHITILVMSTLWTQVPFY